jgi:beta-glucanase (GH16 family)
VLTTMVALDLAQAVAPPQNLGGAGVRYAIDAPLRPPERKADWADEFDESRINPRKWRFDTSRNEAGWYNGEQQYYGPRGARVGGGILTITASADPELREQEDWGGQSVGSAKLTTQGLAAWTYGFVEVRAKLPCGGGMWPAIWMMPTTQVTWPEGGEIDIMEQVSSEPNMVHATVHSAKFVHTKGTQRGATLRVPTSCTAFHRYQMQWTPQAITIGVDGRAYFQVSNDAPGDRGAWPFNRPFYLILNLAAGGVWPGPVDASALPQRMDVDYVRVWKD